MSTWTELRWKVPPLVLAVLLWGVVDVARAESAPAASEAEASEPEPPEADRPAVGASEPEPSETDGSEAEAPEPDAAIVMLGQNGFKRGESPTEVVDQLAKLQEYLEEFIPRVPMGIVQSTGGHVR